MRIVFWLLELIAKAVSWMITALGLWIPLLYSAIFWLVCVSKGTKISEVNHYFWIGIIISVVGSVLWLLYRPYRPFNKPIKREPPQELSAVKRKGKRSADDLTYASPQQNTAANSINNATNVQIQKNSVSDGHQNLPHGDFYLSAPPEYNFSPDPLSYQQQQAQSQTPHQSSHANNIPQAAAQQHYPLYPNQNQGFTEISQSAMQPNQNTQSQPFAPSQPQPQTWQNQQVYNPNNYNYFAQNPQGALPQNYAQSQQTAESQQQEPLSKWKNYGSQPVFGSYQPPQEQKNDVSQSLETHYGNESRRLSSQNFFSAAAFDQKNESDNAATLNPNPQAGTYTPDPQNFAAQDWQLQLWLQQQALNQAQQLQQQQLQQQYMNLMQQQQAQKPPQQFQQPEREPRAPQQKEEPQIFRSRNDANILIYEFNNRIEVYRKTAFGSLERISTNFKHKPDLN